MPAVSIRADGKPFLGRQGGRAVHGRPSGGMAMAISRPVRAASTMASPSECIRCLRARSATASWRQGSQPAMWARTRSRSASLSSPSIRAEMRCPR